MKALRDRLEYVRTESGIKELKELHKRMNTDGYKGVSYEAMRTYHREVNPRDPPIHYIIQYAKVMNVNLTWLVRGDTLWREKEAGG